MMIKTADRVLYTENTRVFSVFQYVTAYKHQRAPFKLTYKVEILGINLLNRMVC
jgi:hypothetical protein